MKTFLTALSVVLLGFCTHAMASGIGSLDEKIIQSPNGVYALHINSQTGLHEVRQGDKVLWSFTRSVWMDDYVLSNNGKFVLWVAWKYVKKEDVSQRALMVFSQDGLVTYRRIDEIARPETVNKIRHGSLIDHLRIWREGISQDNDVVSIKVAGNPQPYQIDFATLKQKQSFTCGTCVAVFQICSECENNPVDHRELNHPPVHGTCIDQAKTSMVN